MIMVFAFAAWSLLLAVVGVVTGIAPLYVHCGGHWRSPLGAALATS